MKQVSGFYDSSFSVPNSFPQLCQARKGKKRHCLLDLEVVGLAG